MSITMANRWNNVWGAAGTSHSRAWPSTTKCVRVNGLCLRKVSSPSRGVKEKLWEEAVEFMQGRILRM